MPLVIDAYPSAFASRACSVSSRKRAGMSSPAGNCARIIKPNCMPATVVSLVARAWVESSASVTGSARDRKSTRLNSSHLVISYAVFCLKKKKNKNKDKLYRQDEVVSRGQSH